MKLTSASNPRKRDYQVAWISALSREDVIARAMLDETFQTPTDLSGDDNCYTYGRIGSHYVVLATLPKGKVGVEQAGRTATDIVHSFPNVQFGLMVGIAGGAPSKENDIRLGDIVVSVPNDSKLLGGVVHYGFGASIQGDGFRPRGLLDSPPEILLSAVSKLQGSHDLHGHQINKIVQKIIHANSPHLEKYSRPDSVVDILFESTFVHPNETDHCRESCHSLSHKIIKRALRPFHQDPCVVHYGTVASASNLVRDATLRDRIAAKDGVLCFEMESAGLMNSRLRCLVIRGICDYADTHKNDDWQHHAAAVAAAYAKELLGTVRPQKLLRVAEEEEFSADEQFSEPVKSAKRGSLANISVPEESDVLELLSFADMNTKRDFSRSHESWNNDWIWTTSLIKWLEEESTQPFWICGKPGSGKSTLAAHIIQNKRTRTALQSQDSKYIILQFFYDYNAGKALANNIQGMLRFILYQLADQCSPIKERLKKLMSDGRLKLDSTPDLLNTTCEVLNQQDHKFCAFIDGLDECDDLIQLVQTCKLIQDSTGIKLCIISRPEDGISEILEITPDILMQDYNAASMYKYAEHKALCSRTVNLDIEKRFDSSLRDDLVKKAEGIMLWFRLAIDQLFEKYEASESDEQITKFVEDIPLTLDAMYERMLNSILSAHQNEAALLIYLVKRWSDLKDSQDTVARVSIRTMWGIYDFIVTEVDDFEHLPKYENPSQLRQRIKLLLRGLVVSENEYEDTAPRTEGDEFWNPQFVRFLHKTVLSFLDKTEWVQKRMHAVVLQNYSEDFWLKISSGILARAAKDVCLSANAAKECLREIGLTSDDAKSSETRKEMRKYLRELMERRRFYVLSLTRAMAPDELADDINMSTRDTSMLKFRKRVAAHFLSPSRTREPVVFPDYWKPRGPILYLATDAFRQFAKPYEKDGKSLFPLVSEAMQSQFVMLLGEPKFSQLAESWLLDTLFEGPAIEHVRDLIAAMVCGFPGYFADRISAKSPTTSQKEVLVSAFVAWSVYSNNGKSKECENLPPILKSLTDQEAQLSIQDLCCLLTKSWCVETAGEQASALKALIDQQMPRFRIGGGSCKHSDKNELLLHWIQLSCLHHEEYGSNAALVEVFLSLLDLLTAFGVDINARCYAGGTALQALLDDTITPLSGRSHLYRKAKFLALAKRGLKPKLESPRTESHGKLLRIRVRIQRLRSYHGEYGSEEEKTTAEIVEWARSYEADGRWPEKMLKEYDRDEGSSEEFSVRHSIAG